MMTIGRSNDEARVALITGAARRVGRATALTLARAGMDVAITYLRSGREAATLVQEIEGMGRRCAAIAVDLERADAARRVVEGFAERFDRLDALVNNASIFGRGGVKEADAATFDRYMAINARAPFLLMQAFAPMLAAEAKVDQPETLGRVVNFLDVQIEQPRRGYAAYNAAKAALGQLTRSAAMELAPQVTVNAVAPGVVAWAAGMSAAEKRAYVKRIALGRAGRPEDAAAVVKFLVCDGHYVTGHVVTVDGGWGLRGGG